MIRRLLRRMTPAGRAKSRLEGLEFGEEATLHAVFPESIYFENDFFCRFSTEVALAQKRGPAVYPDAWIARLVTEEVLPACRQSIRELSGFLSSKSQTPYPNLRAFAEAISPDKSRAELVRELLDRGKPLPIAVRSWDKRKFHIGADGTHRLAKILHHTLKRGDDWEFDAQPTVYSICASAENALLQDYNLWILGTHAADRVADAANVAYEDPQVRTYDVRPAAANASHPGPVGVIAVPRSHPNFEDLSTCIVRARGISFADLRAKLAASTEQ